MALHRPPRILVLGSFGDLPPGSDKSFTLLSRLVSRLRALGWDAFLSGDARSRALAGGALSPRAMTEALEPLADLALYIALVGGTEGGWVAEIVAQQVRFPQFAGRRVLLVQWGVEISSMLRPADGGYLADPPVLIETWVDEDDLLQRATAIALYLIVFGRLPARDPP